MESMEFRLQAECLIGETFRLKAELHAAFFKGSLLAAFYTS